MRRIEKVEEQIRTIFEEKMQSGEMVPALGMDSFINNKHCGCLIGMVHPRHNSAMYHAAEKLGITYKQAHALERGFELRKPDMFTSTNPNDPYYKLGARIRKHYT